MFHIYILLFCFLLWFFFSLISFPFPTIITLHHLPHPQTPHQSSPTAPLPSHSLTITRLLALSILSFYKFQRNPWSLRRNNWMRNVRYKIAVIFWLFWWLLIVLILMSLLIVFKWFWTVSTTAYLIVITRT